MKHIQLARGFGLLRRRYLEVVVEGALQGGNLCLSGAL